MAKRKPTTVITLTDDEGVDRDFKALELFAVGKKNFALMQPVKGRKGEVNVFKFTLGKDGEILTFTAPTDAEFALAIDALEGDDTGEESACGCCCDCAEPAAKPKKKAAARKPAPKAKAKKR